MAQKNYLMNHATNMIRIDASLRAMAINKTQLIAETNEVEYCCKVRNQALKLIGAYYSHKKNIQNYAPYDTYIYQNLDEYITDKIGDRMDEMDGKFERNILKLIQSINDNNGLNLVDVIIQWLENITRAQIKEQLE